jgi:hypothetical protein
VGSGGAVGDEAAACSKAGDKAVASSKAGDEVKMCSGARIEDGRWQWHDGVWGDRRARALGSFKKLLSVVRNSTGTEILGHLHVMRDVHNIPHIHQLLNP